MSIRKEDVFSIVWEFEAAPEAILNLSITTWPDLGKNQTLQFLFCRDFNLSPLRTSTIEQVCTTPLLTAVSCLWQTQIDNSRPSADLAIKAPSKDWYYLLQLNCQNIPYHLRIKYFAENPDGEFLSLSDVPFKLLFAFLGIGWTILTLIWMFNWIPYRYFNVNLQSVVTIVPLLQTVFCYISYLLWVTRSQSGIEENQYFWASLVLQGLCKSALFASLLLIANGWGILRDSLGRNEILEILGLSAVLGFCYSLYIYFGGFLLFLVVLSYCLALRSVFASVLFYSHTLVAQFHLLRQFDVDHSSTPAFSKFQMFKKFQTCTVVYICVDVIFHLWAKIFLRQVPWIEELVEHALLMMTVFLVGIIFRMRPFRPYVFRMDLLQPSDASVSVSEDDSNRSDLALPLISYDQGEWHPGMPIPEIPKGYSFRSSQTPSTVVVERPSPEDENWFSIGSLRGKVPSV